MNNSGPEQQQKAPATEIKHPDTLSCVLGIFLTIIGIVAFYFLGKVHALFFRIPLYLFGTALVAFGLFMVVDEFTSKAEHVYSADVLIVTVALSLLKLLNFTDVTPVRWLLIILAGLVGFVAFAQSWNQLVKDTRSHPIVGWLMTVLIILSLYVALSWYMSMPMILLFFPATFVMGYGLYLRNSFLGVAVPPGSGFRERMDPRKALKNLWGIRWSLVIMLTFFSALFYFVVMNVPSDELPFGLLYEVVAPAYLGILAIVIAFAILFVPQKGKDEATTHFRNAVVGLAQMYLFFAMITLVALLLGTKIDNGIFIGKNSLNIILDSVRNLINICRILAAEFTILTFPVGLWYLYAMIKDFMTPSEESISGPNP